MTCSFNPESQVLFCGIYIVDDTLEDLLLMFEMTINSFLPSLLIIYLNTKTISTLTRLKKKLTKHSRSAALKKLTKLERQKSQYSSRDITNKIGINHMLIIVSFTFVVLTLPIYINRLIFAFLPKPLELFKVALYYGLDCYFGILYILNSSINFYLYVLSGQAFRKDVKHILCDVKHMLCCSKKDDHPEPPDDQMQLQTSQNSAISQLLTIFSCSGIVAPWKIVRRYIFSHDVFYIRKNTSYSLSDIKHQKMEHSDSNISLSSISYTSNDMLYPYQTDINYNLNEGYV